MAKIAILADNNAIIATKTIPNSFTNFVVNIVGGSTNAETALNFLEASVPVLKQHFYEERVKQLQQTPKDELRQAELDATSELTGSWQ